MENFLNTNELARRLNVSISTVYQLRLRGLPFLKLGSRTIRYDLTEIKKWMEANGPGVHKTFAQ